MTRPSFIRLSGNAAVLAGLLYICSEILDLVQPQTPVFTKPTDYMIEALFASALLLTIVAYTGIHVIHRGRSGRFEMYSFVATAGGTTSFAIAAVATIISGQEVLGIFFLLGVLAALIGSICFGTAILQARVLPGWFGLLLMLGLPVSVLLESFGGGILLGFIWLVMGYVIATRGTPSQSPSIASAHATSPR